MDKTCRPSRGSAKREAVLDAAQACFLEMGYAGTSMDAVAARAGVSKATIYAHFQGKDELFGAIMRRRCEQSIPDMPPPGPGEDARTVLTDVARRMLALFLLPEAMAVYRIVVAESPRHPDLATAFYAAGPERGKAGLSETFAELGRRGELVVDDTWRAADLFVTMLRGEFFHRALLGLPPRPGFDFDSTVATAVETVLRAFRP
ncbi:MAG: TetR/AcrR family transcriptional regulator [Pseudomonadota bacterium]